MSNTFDKLSVLDSFIEEVDSYLPEIEADLEHLAQSPHDRDALEETHRRTHTIGGSASMMDFPGLAHVSHGMEDILADALDGLIVLDADTIGLLRRSLGRIRTLLNGIREGVDEEAIIAEDDQDYARYRELVDAAVASGPAVEAQETQEHRSIVASAQQEHVSTPAHNSAAAEVDTGQDKEVDSSSLPSFDEVLASFRTPSVSTADEVAWPEEPAATASASPSFDAIPVASAEDTKYVQPSTSALESLVASTRQPMEAATLSALQYPEMESEVHPASGSGASHFTGQPHETSHESTANEPMNEALMVAHPSETSLESVMGERNHKTSLPQPTRQADNESELPQSYGSLQKEAQALDEQVANLKSIVAQLHSTMSLIESQRSEFKSFLDGSKDALDRMEDWAGKAMHLNLRNSPEQVRRYLPLSVMWVANSKLKKVLALLNQITSGVEATDEHIQDILQQFHRSLTSYIEAIEQLQTRPPHIFAQEPGWTPWEMHLTREPQTLRERVLFERQGDLTALRSELEAQLREEIRREYEARPFSLAARAELEQQIRNEVRREFEAKRDFQKSLLPSQGDENIRALEERLRSEIEIQVRQEFLQQIATNGSLAAALQPTPSMPSSSNFVDRASAGTLLQGNAGGIPLQSAPPLISTTDSHTPNTTYTPTRFDTKGLPARQQGVPHTDSHSAGASSAAASSSSPSFGDLGEEAIEIFRLEAEEHLQTISMHVAALEKEPTNRELIQGIRRAVHTLKGAAAMMGFHAIADLSHVSEDLLDSIMEGATAISPSVLSLILDTAETLDVLIMGRGQSDGTDEARVETLRRRYIELLGEGNTALAPTDEDIDVDSDEDVLTSTSSIESVIAGSSASDSSDQRAVHGDLSVRVRLQKLDELVNLFGELLVNRSALEDRIGRLSRLVADAGISSNRLRDVGQKLESRFEAATLPSGRSIQVMPGEGDESVDLLLGAQGNGNNGKQPAHLAEFDELELDRYTEFHQLTRGLSEGISDTSTLSNEMDAIIRECENIFSRESRLSTTFQDRLMKVRLVPLATMTPRLYRAARAVALKQHKEFEFFLEGEGTEVDRTVYEEIAGPLLHLMRNAVSHGIETPDVRVQKGKSPAGKITLSASYEGNMVVITVREDGTGIDPERIRNSAIARGLIRPDQVLNESDLIELIFRPGFSTAESVSEESGRGVGLDVVRDSVARLRGTLVVDSTPGQGTAFTMKFPTSLAIQSVMMVRVAGQTYAIPAVMVEAVGRLDTFKRTTVGNQPAVVVQNDTYPLTMLAQYLALPVSIVEEKSPILLVSANGQRMALVVDEVKSKSDVVMKNLGPHLRHVHGIAGGTVLGNGQVVLVLELTELLATNRSRLPMSGAGTAVPMQAEGINYRVSQPTFRQSADSLPGRQTASMRPIAPVSPVAADRGRHILVVDDSPSVRRVVSSMLKQNGWEVQTARDGVEALEMISRETPAAVLLDIEMPRMDGYELIATVRSQEPYRTLPLIVLTSRAATKHQQRALQLGASAYVVKPYQDEELLNVIKAQVYGAVAR